MVVRGEGDVVDPVGVCLDLLAEACGRGRGRSGIVVVGVVVVVVVVAVTGEVEMQVPGAEDAIAPARVAGRRRQPGGPWSRRLRGSQNRMGRVDGQAVDAQAMAARRLGQWQYVRDALLCVASHGASVRS